MRAKTKEEYSNEELWELNKPHRDTIESWTEKEIKENIDGYIDEIDYCDFEQAIVYLMSYLTWFSQDATWYALKQFKLKRNIKDGN